MEAAAGHPKAMVNLARQAWAAGDQALAIELVERALTTPGLDEEARTLARQFLSKGVPAWHFSIVRDARRNEAYDAALQRAVRPGCKVLEIGTGSGLLALMAARAGAEVVTCELNPIIAAAARRVIAANGLSASIRVVGKHSDELDLEADLGGPADILVSEIISNDVVGQGALPALRNAARLLKPGARSIPGTVRVRVALADYQPPADGLMGSAAGFDLRAFNTLARPYREVPVQSPNLSLRGEARDLFSFDFTRPNDLRPSQGAVKLSAAGGRVSGVVQWIALEMDEVGLYENRPGEAPSCWGAMFWPFDQSVETRAGEVITIAGRYDDTSLRLWRS